MRMKRPREWPYLTCGHVGVGEALLEEVCHGGRFDGFKSIIQAQSLFLLPAGPMYNSVPSPAHVCLCATMLPAMTIMH